MNKTETYRHTLSQIKGVIEGRSNLVSDLANVCAILRENHHHFWIGYYLVENEELHLGPFQGPVACTIIAKGKGVCGSSWAERRSLVVPDVHQFPGHIACSSLSNSEIVVPFFDRSNNVIGVLDLDSTDYGTFDDQDRIALEEINSILTQKHG